MADQGNSHSLGEGGAIILFSQLVRAHAGGMGMCLVYAMYWVEAKGQLGCHSSDALPSGFAETGFHSKMFESTMQLGFLTRSW